MSKSYLGERAYETIKDRIIRCVYQPDSFINEEQLVAELNISRTPIRSALVRLEQERMVQIISKKGVHVTDISYEQIHDIYECRFLIEPYAVLHYGNRFPKKELLDYLSCFSATEDNWSFYRHDNKFHKQIVDLCGNDLLSSYYDSLQSLSLRISVRSGDAENRVTNSNHEHISIINALLQDDYPLASELIKNHLEIAKRVAYNILVVK